MREMFKRIKKHLDNRDDSFAPHPLKRGLYSIIDLSPSNLSIYNYTSFQFCKTIFPLIFYILNMFKKLS